MHTLTVTARADDFIGVRVSDGATDDAARLIAAAPDMLEALRAMVDYFGHHPDVDNGLDETLTAARAAIARATGGR